MPLSEQDKSDLVERMTECVMADEPEQVLSALQRFARKQAQLPEHSQYERRRWLSFKHTLEDAMAGFSAPPPQPDEPIFAPDQSNPQDNKSANNNSVPQQRQSEK